MKAIVKSSTLYALAILGSCANNPGKTSAPAPIGVHVLTVQNNQREETLAYSGTLEPDNTAHVGFAVPGTVSNVAVNEGQPVKQGQLLATIDDTEYSNACAIATAALDQTEDMHRRLETLYKKGSVPEKDYIDIKTRLAQAVASKRISTRHLADTRLYAPMSGIITAKRIERGTMASPGVPAFTIVKTDKVYARVTVPESEVGTIKKGMPASVYIASLRDTVTGTIAIINPQADEITRTYVVKVLLDNPAGNLLPGMLADVRLHTGHSQTIITLPATAVVRDADNITYVFVSSPQHTAIRRRVTIGGLHGKDQIIVDNGLSQGDNVVIAGHTRLKDGSPLHIE